MESVHLICGPVAAGKTTLARRLAAERNAVRFAIDDWMHTLYGPDLRPDVDLPWALARFARCQTVIWSTAAQVLGSGRQVVLELGLMRAADRARIRTLIEDAGHPARFHFVDADVATRRQRVLDRNATRGATYSFEVTPAMFEAIERLYEPPTDEERRPPVETVAAHHG